jgi:hypothetical protein
VRMPCQRNRFVDGAGDAAYLVTVFDKNLFREIREHEVVFDNQDLEHTLSSSLGPDRCSIADGQEDIIVLDERLTSWLSVERQTTTFLNFKD